MNGSTLNLDRQVNDILGEAFERLHAKLDALGAPAPLSAAHVEYDLQSGQAKFSWENGVTRRASAQLVGVAQPEPGGPPDARFFRWGWDEASIQANLKAPAMRLLELGRQKGWEEATSAHIRVHIDRIWAFCGLAAELTGAAGAVMCRTQGREVFLTIGPLET